MNPDTNLNKPKTIGLALSGGGIRGVAHLGVMQALLDKGIRISQLSGTSAGAIAAAFLAQGIAPKDALEIIIEARLLKLLRPSIGYTGLLSITQVEGLLKSYFPQNSFNELKIPLTVCVVDLGEGKLAYFNEGDLCKCLLASCCLPGIFKPIVIEGHLYVDGGILNNFPVEPLIGNCDFIIGVTCNHMTYSTQFDSFGQMVDRAAMLAINVNLDQRKELCDVVIEPHNLGSYGIFDTKFAEDIYWIGYEEALKTLKANSAIQTVLPANRQKR